jgi:hypothetical protein
MKKEYKGHKYEIKYCDPNDDWSTSAGMFYIDMVIAEDRYFDTYKGAEIAANRMIDDFIDSIPTTESEWIDAVSRCVVRNGYECFHVDKDVALDLLRKASKYFKEA